MLVPLFLAAGTNDPHVVLTRRRADLRRHAGEIAFPGGRKDAGDASLADDLPEEQVEKLRVIAAKCPVHRALEGEVMFQERIERVHLAA